MHRWAKLQWRSVFRESALDGDVLSYDIWWAMELKRPEPRARHWRGRRLRGGRLGFLSPSGSTSISLLVAHRRPADPSASPCASGLTLLALLFFEMRLSAAVMADKRERSEGASLGGRAHDLILHRSSTHHPHDQPHPVPTPTCRLSAQTYQRHAPIEGEPGMRVSSPSRPPSALPSSSLRTAAFSLATPGPAQPVPCLPSSLWSGAG